MVTFLVLFFLYAVALTVALARAGYRSPVASVPASGSPRIRPTRVHSNVLVSKLHRPTLRALAYANLVRSDQL